LDKKYILSKILQMKTLTKKEKMMKKMLMTIAVLVMISSLLMAQGYSGGDGSEGNPYQIANEADLIYLSQHSDNWDNHFKQTASISFNADESQVDWDGDGVADGASPAGWSPIGNSTTNFTGDYNGQNFTINNLYINRTATEYVGLFGYVYGSVIQNIGLNDVNITGNAHTGGLLGYSSNSSTITNCFSTGSVSGSGNYVGGLIGESGSSTMNNSYSTSTVTGVQRIGGLIGESTSSTIEKSYSTGSVSGENMMGGFVGFNDGSSSLSNCYSLGNVTRTSESGLANGGFVGQFYSGTITNCYSKGSVTYDGSVVNNEGFAGWVSGAEGSTQTFSNCFWDEETSGSSSSDGEGAELVGENTANMKTLATFTGVSWDIVSGYDTNHIWNLESGVNSGYPYLSWAKTVDQSLPVTLASFTGKASKAGVVLEWETSAEIENSGFVIYRSEENSPRPPLRGGVESAADHWTNSPSLEGAGGVLLASYLTTNALVGQGCVTKSTHYTFTDNKVEAGKNYVYTLSDVSFSGKETELGSVTLSRYSRDSGSAIVAENYTLMPVYPNPFNASFTVPFSLNEAMNVKISLYNIQGQQVMTILQSELNAGDYAYQVNADNLGSGVYLVKTQLTVTDLTVTERSRSDQGRSDRRSHTQKIVLMK
jgi:hypothetical protein